MTNLSICQTLADALDGFELGQPKSSVHGATCAIVESLLADLLDLGELLFGHGATLATALAANLLRLLLDGAQVDAQAVDELVACR
jgi:hypothetical protein